MTDVGKLRSTTIQRWVQLLSATVWNKSETTTTTITTKTFFFSFFLFKNISTYDMIDRYIYSSLLYYVLLSLNLIQLCGVV